MGQPEATLTGKVCVITGASSGIGKETAAGLARLGATVVMVCRDRERGEAARAEVQEKSGGQAVDLLFADLSSLQAVRQLAAELKERYPHLHVLINNAGALHPTRQVTVDGLEQTFAVNHLAGFLLTHLLLDVLKKSAPARIINVSSGAHQMGAIDFEDLQAEKRYTQLKAYSQSKLANVLFTVELAKRLSGTGVTVNAVHPGTVNTNFGKDAKGLFGVLVKVIRPIMRTPEKGAETPIYLASSPELDSVTGRYFVDRQPTATARQAQDAAAAQRLWQVSEKLVGLAS